jgi:hypothetical protein
MNEAIQFKTGAVAVGNRITWLDMRRCWLFIALAAWLTLSRTAQATPDGDVGNRSTAMGLQALLSDTIGGSLN